jgi:hypothetical protein
MRTTTAAPECAATREQLHRLGVLLDEALAECHALHHRIREIQLHIAELSASADAGRPVAAVRGTGAVVG